jgi:hypothetical protein
MESKREKVSKSAGAAAAASAPVYCLLNCFNNYDICASKLIQFYIQNAITALAPSGVAPPPIQTYFETGPYLLYVSLLQARVVGLNSSKQYQDFVTILGLTAVTLARVAAASTVIFANQGVVTLPGFATMYAMANQLGKTCVMWTDDLRNLWGSSNDPLVIGMAATPYRYLWTAAENPNQDNHLNVQKKGLNGENIVLNLGVAASSCPTLPVANQNDFENNWNTFVTGILIANEANAGNVPATLSKWTQGLILLGQNIINYVEVTKPSTVGPRGWVPSGNPGLWWDMNFIISQNLPLLNPKQQQFFNANVQLVPQPSNTPVGPPPSPGPYGLSGTRSTGGAKTLFAQNNDSILRAMDLGMGKMLAGAF